MAANLTFSQQADLAVLRNTAAPHKIRAIAERLALRGYVTEVVGILEERAIDGSRIGHVKGRLPMSAEARAAVAAQCRSSLIQPVRYERLSPRASKNLREFYEGQRKLGGRILEEDLAGLTTAAHIQASRKRGAAKAMTGFISLQLIDGKVPVWSELSDAEINSVADQENLKAMMEALEQVRDEPDVATVTRAFERLRHMPSGGSLGGVYLSYRDLLVDDLVDRLELLRRTPVELVGDSIIECTLTAALTFDTVTREDFVSLISNSAALAGRARSYIPDDLFNKWSLLGELLFVDSAKEIARLLAVLDSTEIQVGKILNHRLMAGELTASQVSGAMAMGRETKQLAPRSKRKPKAGDTSLFIPAVLGELDPAGLAKVYKGALLTVSKSRNLDDVAKAALVYQFLIPEFASAENPKAYRFGHKNMSFIWGSPPQLEATLISALTKNGVEFRSSLEQESEAGKTEKMSVDTVVDILSSSGDDLFSKLGLARPDRTTKSIRR